MQTIFASVFAALLGGALAVTWALPALARGQRGDAAAGGAVAAVCLALAVTGIWSVRSPGRFTVVVSEQGIRNGSGEDIDWVAWSEIASWRERTLSRRIELLDHSGQVKARIELQVTPLGELLETVVLHARAASGPSGPRSEFASRGLGSPGASLAILLATTAGAIVLYIAQHLPTALLFPVLVGAALWMDWRSTPSRVRVGDDGLEVRLAGRDDRLPWAEIEECRIALVRVRRSTRLDVRAYLQDGGSRSLLPAGEDALDVYAAVRRALPETIDPGAPRP